MTMKNFGKLLSSCTTGNWKKQLIRTKWNSGSRSCTKPWHKNQKVWPHDLISLWEIKSVNYFLFPHCLLVKRSISNHLHKIKFFTECF
jgi:hypothetical protein